MKEKSGLKQKIKEIFKGVVTLKTPFLCFFFATLSLFICCTCFFDTTVDFVTTSMQRESTQVSFEVLPIERTINFASRYRYLVTEAKYQTDLTGSSKLYYSAHPDDEFVPITIGNEEKAISPTLISSYDNTFSSYFDFSTIDGKKVSDFVDFKLNDIFITKALATQMVECGLAEDFDSIINRNFKLKTKYGDGVIHNMDGYVLGILDDDSISNISTFEGDNFIYCLFGEIIQYRVTYASLKAIINTKEKAANRFLISNFNKIVDISEGDLTANFYMIEHGEVVVGRLTDFYHKCKEYYSTGKTIVGIFLILAILVAFGVMTFNYFKKHSEAFYRYYNCIHCGAAVLMILAFVLVHIVPPFMLIKLPVCFLTPISAVVVFAFLVINLIMISLLKMFFIKEPIGTYCTFAKIKI